MDFRTVKEKLIQYYIELKRNRIQVDMMILFGSFAKGKSQKDSDIDVAIVSNKFGRDRHKEIVKLNKIARKVDSRIEAVAISMREYFDPNSISPILDEIKKTGTSVL